MSIWTYTWQLLEQIHFYRFACIHWIGSSSKMYSMALWLESQSSHASIADLSSMKGRAKLKL
uniref:Uncharacterized protein n=1 Tax=Daphnia magna TaxID=35525 RepID=A0A0P6BMV2_9CRUS